MLHTIAPFMLLTPPQSMLSGSVKLTAGLSWYCPGERTADMRYVAHDVWGSTIELDEQACYMLVLI